MSDTGPLLIAICTLGKVRVEWALHIAHAVMPVGRQRNMMSVQGMTTNDARNYAFEVALEMGVPRLMFWDDDILPRNQNALMLLTQAMDIYDKVDVLSAVYPGRVKDVCEPIVVKEKGGGMWYGWRDGNIHPVYMAGTGFTMFRMEAFKDVSPPSYVEPTKGVELRKWFTPDNEMEISDDVHFAKLCEEYGLKWYVHGAVVCDQADLDGELYRISDEAEMPQLVEA